MTNLRLTVAAGALALAAASSALAQQGQPDPAPAAPPAASAPDAAAAGVNTSATQGPQGVETIVQGNNVLVTNGPIPDTKANRARYGQPMSMTGRRTKPAGN